MTVTIDAHDLSAITGEAMDALVPGRVCRVCLPDRGRTIRQRIISRAYADLLGEPGRVTLTLATEGSSAVGQLAGLVVDTTVQRRLVERGIEGLDELTIATNENLNLVSENINVLGKKVTVNAEQISLKASKEIVDGLVEDYANIDIGVDHILTQIYQNGEVMSEINQTVDGIDAWSKDTEGNLGELLVTANGIKGQVTSVSGNVGKLLLDSDEFRTTLSKGDTVLSEIEQLQDQINLKVNDANGTMGKLSIKADSITQKIESAGNQISQLVVKTDGMTYTLQKNNETLALFDVNQQHMITQIGSAASSLGTLEVTAHSITQKVEDVNKGVGKFQVTADRISGSVTDLSGRVGELELKSNRFDVAIGKDGLGGKIHMIEGLLDLKVEGGGNTVSVRLNAMDNSISLKANKTYVDELVANRVTTEQLEAKLATFEESFSEYIGTAQLDATRVNTTNLDVDGSGYVYSLSCNNFTVNGSGASSKSKSVLVSRGNLTVNKRFLTLMKGDGTTVTLDVVTDVSLSNSRSETIKYLGQD